VAIRLAVHPPIYWIYIFIGVRDLDPLYQEYQFKLVVFLAFSSGSWYLKRNTAGFTGLQFGVSTDKPVPALVSDMAPQSLVDQKSGRALWDWH
jgi:hypothetical protein